MQWVGRESRMSNEVQRVGDSVLDMRCVAGEDRLRRLDIFPSEQDSPGLEGGGPRLVEQSMAQDVQRQSTAQL